MPPPPRKRSLALSKVYGLLETGPVVLLTTSHQGAANVMTMSWHAMMEFEPPHHRGYGCFMVAGETIQLASKMQ